MGSSSSSGAAGGGRSHCARRAGRRAGLGRGDTRSFSSATTSEAMDNDLAGEAWVCGRNQAVLHVPSLLSGREA